MTGPHRYIPPLPRPERNGRSTNFVEAPTANRIPLESCRGNGVDGLWLIHTPIYITSGPPHRQSGAVIQISSNDRRTTLLYNTIPIPKARKQIPAERRRSAERKATPAAIAAVDREKRVPAGARCHVVGLTANVKIGETSWTAGTTRTASTIDTTDGDVVGQLPEPRR